MGNGPQRTLFLILGATALGSFAGTASAQPPNEREMRQALQAKFREVNAHYRELGARCERREFRDNPLLAMQCLQLCGAGGGKCHIEFKLTRFERLGCGRGGGTAGYLCEFLAGFSSSSPYARGAMNDITGGANAGKGRFVKRGGSWRFLPLQRR